MKKLIVIFLFTLLFISCTPIQPEPIIITETITETVVVTETVEIEDTTKIDELEDELDKYINLISNLDEYLGYVYYGYAENDEWIIDGFTAFSMVYKGNKYIITAGHAVEDENGKYYNHRFKANFSDRWVEPELLAYDNDYNNKMDYAIFEGNIDRGFKVDFGSDTPQYIINESISSYRRVIVEGESGSPVIDIDGEVTEIATTDLYSYNTDIDEVLKAIDNLN